ncbi:endonuclease/exonuclease/phosphatase family protein [Haloarcula pellucida]|uniref:Endonuclease n=1 Tax=Haloarcula pellucida TaxID=1427151 RepID=A0A830GL37_9EURY|nr:endonuclease/exonuclease/phosphatase family protein [Halomicroarcula pellucida]MBX0348508.1 endonuclease/exonuclease/phosphatase family protein [Halomicroarcula pellucida]GGN93020.1 endonuclease [Halomicroarcula pellucida]
MEPVRVMSFNVRYDAPEDGLDNWSHRRRLVAGTIRYHAPDVVGVQEAQRHQILELETLLPTYDWVGDPRDTVEAGGEHTAIGYRTARFDCEGTDTFWLSETPETPGSVGWDARHPRVATWGRLRDRATGDALLAVNTHLDHIGAEAREKGIDLVLSRLNRVVEGEAVVLSGDFNCVVGAPAHQRTDGHTLPDGRTLEDARDRTPVRHGPTTTRTDFHDLVPEMGIDHVFVSEGVAVDSWAAVTDRDDDHYASDHLPVAVDCRF